MDNMLVAPIIVGTICATIYGLFELFARRKERIAFIEKLAEIRGMGEIAGKIDITFGKSFSTWALRGGCLLVGLGIGVLVAFFLIIVTLQGLESGGQLYRMENLIYSGSILLFGGIGLVIAFILEVKCFKKK